MKIGHHPVLYQEVLRALQPKPGGRYVDGTLGAGGHATGILNASSPDGLLLGMDLDPQAIQLATQNLTQYASRIIIVQASYLTLPDQLEKLGWASIDGMLLDLGVSSMQLDIAERGFSFQMDAPLDMRFDPTNPVTAFDLVNNLPEDQLASILFRYGEEPQARRIARAIVKARPVTGTKQLADIVLKSTHPGHKTNNQKRSLHGNQSSSNVPFPTRLRVHPATQTFQALRIAVNRELETLEKTLPLAVKALAPGGRLVVISFHSLEDRVVKQYFRQESRDCICPPRQPICTCGHIAMVRELFKRPLKPGSAEIETNPRSRSSRLRAVEKL